MGKFEKNHFFPNYNLKYWKKIYSKVYDRTTNEDFDFVLVDDFYFNKFYYFDNAPEVEKKLAKIERYMSELLKKIPDSVDKNSVELSEYQINFIQLFLFLQAYRQLSMTEVIKANEERLYENNNYTFGVFNIKNFSEMQLTMNSLVDTLENIIKKKNLEDLTQWMSVVNNTHLVIAKNNYHYFCQSDSHCLIANDFKNNHLYTYFPQTPSLAFFLVNTKYFMKEETILNYLAKNYHIPSKSIQSDFVKKLVCQYQKEAVTQETEPIESEILLDQSNLNFYQLKEKKIWLNLVELSKNEVNYFNKVLFDGSEKFVHYQKIDYIEYLESLANDDWSLDVNAHFFKNFVPFNIQSVLSYNPEKKNNHSVQYLSINPIDIVMGTLFYTKKGSANQITVKQELKSWLDVMQCKSNFDEESLILDLYSQSSLDNNQTIESRRIELLRNLSKEQINGLKLYIDSFDQIKSKKIDNINRNRELNQESRPNNFFRFRLNNSYQNPKQYNKFFEKNLDLERISWMRAYQNKNKANIEKIDNLNQQFQDNSSQILDFEEPQPGTSGLTREELQRIQRRQNAQQIEWEESELEL